MDNTAQEKAKHTPGPWEITTHGIKEDGMYIPIYAEDGLWISEAKGRGGIPGSKVGPNNNAEIAANAALIAAAPDLLAALVALVDCVSVRIDDPRIKRFDAAKDAIKKATTFEFPK